MKGDDKGKEEAKGGKRREMTTERQKEEREMSAGREGRQGR